jgi:hypothetical protein
MERLGEVELRLKMEKFIKEYVSLIRLLSTIFAVGRILTNSQQCTSYHAAATEIQITLHPNEFHRLSPGVLYKAYSDHVTASESVNITNGYVRNSLHLKNPLGC